MHILRATKFFIPLMMTNQTIKRPREDETTEEEYDEKENILIQETEESGTEKEAHSEPVQIRNEETVIHLSRYWPEGSGVADMNIYPKDTTLLYLYSLELESNGRCKIDEITELVRMYEYDDGRVRKYSRLIQHLVKKFQFFLVIIITEILTLLCAMYIVLLRINATETLMTVNCEGSM